MIAQMLSDLETLQRDINKVSTVNVNKKGLKETAVKLGTAYFNEVRPRIPKIDSSLIDKLDSSMQDLIRLGHGNNTKASYKSSLKVNIATLKEINISVAITPKVVAYVQPSEQKIIETLSKIVPSASLSYQQAVIDLGQVTARASYRGTAVELRESLRETLDYLAPDDEITKEPNFQFEPKQTKPTMKQKVRFILKSRGYGDSKRTPTEKTTELIDELFGQITRAIYDRASLATHKKTEKDEVEKIKRFVDVVLFELLAL